jgi:hypothetical protein
MIGAALWGDEVEERDPKGLDVPVHRLRVRLAEYGARIETVWSMGWRLSMEAKLKVREAIEEFRLMHAEPIRISFAT